MISENWFTFYEHELHWVRKVRAELMKMKSEIAQPDKVEKLALICPGGVVPDRISFVFKALFYSLLGKSGSKRMVRMLYAEQPMSEGAGKMISVMRDNFRHRIGVLPIFSDEELRHLTMHTLLLGGTKDALRDIGKIATRLRKLVPQLTVTIVPGAGHAIINTAEYILPFLSAKS